MGLYKSACACVHKLRKTALFAYYGSERQSADTAILLEK